LQAFLNLDDVASGLEIKVNDIYRADTIARTIEKKTRLSLLGKALDGDEQNLFAALKLERGSCSLFSV
jgi:lipoprotein-releasing system permease protein